MNNEDTIQGITLHIRQERASNFRAMEELVCWYKFTVPIYFLNNGRLSNLHFRVEGTLSFSINKYQS